MSKVVIVGAGLCGLFTARTLVADPKFVGSITIIEREYKVGGRLQSSMDKVDLGGTWTWGDVNLQMLAKDLGVGTFEQPWEGDVVIGGRRRKATPHDSPCGPGGRRFAGGGAASLVSKMAEEMSEKVEIRLDSTVEKVTSESVLLSDGSNVAADVVVIAAPPRATADILFEPPLPPQQEQAMGSTFTWMATTLKFAAVYDTPFWTDRGLSGFGQGLNNSNVVEVTWDASDGQICALGGFGRPLLGKTPEETNSAIVADLVSIFGEAAGLPNDVDFIDWSTRDSDRNKKNLHMSYGHPLLRAPHIEGRVIFAGSESEDQHGHMEGAMVAALRAAEEVMLKVV